MASQYTTAQARIKELEEISRHHQQCAIQLAEAPGGFHRQKAAHLEHEISRLRRHSKSLNSIDQFFIWLLVSLFVGGSAAVFSKYWVDGVLTQIGKTARLMSNAEEVKLLEQASKSIPSAPVSQVPLTDPAADMNGRFYASQWGGDFVGLDSGMDNYRRLAGTMARIQAKALRRRSAARVFPGVWINRTSDKCFDRSVIGAYSPSCQVIKLDYTDGNSVYEHPIELEVVLAHEWGHHLINVSDVRISPMEREVISDCVAGAAFGYYVNHSLISLDEAVKAIELVVSVGNNSDSGHHPNSETRLRAFTGGLLSVSAPSHPAAAQTVPFCSSMENILDVGKIREMGLTWQG